jgi:SSS family solute:Na+ symporter
MKLHVVDLVIVVTYLLGITAIGVFSGRKSTGSSASYFLAARSLRWPVVGLALFATNISTVHLIGLASSGFSEGMVVGNFEWLAPFLLITLGLVFAPFYFRTKISTLPEYIEGRYGPVSRTILAVMALFGALFIHMGVTLYAGAVVFQHFVAIDTLWSILIVSGLTLAYTALGGLRAVAITESFQTVLLLTGAAAITGFGLHELAERGITSLDALRAAARPEQLSMLRPDGKYAWYAMLLGYPVLGIWYWCSDQTIVQRVLGARTERDAQVGPVFAGFIKVLPVFLMVLPGVMGYVLFKDQIAAQPDATLIVLIQNLLPVGLQGLVLAGLMAALMATTAGALNSAATLVCIDIVKRLRPQTPDRALVRIGQATTAAVLLLAIAWSSQGAHFGGIFAGINQMISVLAPPISTVFIWGIFWRRGTAQASAATLVAGFLLGIVVFCLDFPAVSGLLFGKNAAGEPVQLVTQRLGIPFMLQAWWLFCMCSVIFVAVSLRTPPPSEACVRAYCWRSPLAAVTEKPFEGLRDVRVWAAALVLVMIICYAIFA